MRKPLTVAALVLLPLLGVLAWLVSSRDGSSAPPPGVAATAPAESTTSTMSSAAAAAEAGASEPTAKPPAADAARTEVSTAPVPAVHGAMLHGKVVDEHGDAIGDALVVCVARSELRARFTRAAMPASAAPEPPRREVRTDASGSFALTAAGAGPVQVEVLVRGYQVLDRNATAAVDGVDLGTLTLQRGAVLAGRVTDSAGRPVAGARVDVVSKDMPAWAAAIEPIGAASREPDGRSATTAADGRFELTHVAPDELRLRARHSDHPIAYSDPVQVAAGDERTGVTIVLDAGADIRGRVVGVPDDVTGVRVLAIRKPDPSSGESKQGGAFEMVVGDTSEMLGEAGLPIGERSADVEADGAFTLHGLEAQATYRVWAVRIGEGLADASVCSDRKEAVAGSYGVELGYVVGVTVTFHVVDGGSEAPLERLWVGHRLVGGGVFADLFRAMAHPTRQQDYPGGAVTIANLRPKPRQKLSITVEALGHAELRRDDITLPEQGVLDLGVLRLDPAPVVDVQVVAAKDGSPVAGAKVTLDEDHPQQPSHGSISFSTTTTVGDGTPAFVPEASGPRTATTDENGRCQLNGLPGKTMVIAVDSDHHAPYRSDPIVLPATGDVEHRAPLVSGGVVEVTVVTPEGTPVEGAKVNHRAGGTERDSAKTDASGVARFERLLPGRHHFAVAPPERSGGFTITTRLDGDASDDGGEQVDLTDGELAQVRLVKQPGASLSGVVRVDGMPLAGAHVKVLSGASSSAEERMQQEIAARFEGLLGGSKSAGVTGDDGRYELTDLQAGPCRLQISHDDRAMTALVPATLTAGDNVVDVDLQDTVLRGTVRDEQGAPIAGATVRVDVAPDKGADDEANPAPQLVGGMVDSLASGFGVDVGRGGTHTDANGAFELHGVRTDVALVVWARADGFVAASSDPVQATAGAMVDAIAITMAPAGRIRVHASGQGPFAMVSATFEGAGESASSTPAMAMLRGGRAVLDGLRPGTWQVKLQTQDDQDHTPRTVQVIARQTVEVEF